MFGATINGLSAYVVHADFCVIGNARHNDASVNASDGDTVGANTVDSALLHNFNVAGCAHLGAVSRCCADYGVSGTDACHLPFAVDGGDFRVIAFPVELRVIRILGNRIGSDCTALADFNLII